MQKNMQEKPERTVMRSDDQVDFFVHFALELMIISPLSSCFQLHLLTFIFPSTYTRLHLFSKKNIPMLPLSIHAIIDRKLNQSAS